MPLISTLGAMSSRGFGEFAQSAQGKYIEDYFSTYLYTGNGTSQTINNGIGLFDTAAWSTFKLSIGVTKGNAVTADSSGNIYLVGTSDSPTNYSIIAKYNSSGILQWQRTLTEGSTNSGNGVVIDSSGNVYFYGIARNSGGDYYLLAKYDSSGTLQWKKFYGDNVYNGPKACIGIAIDSSNNIFTTGTIAASSGTFVFLAKFDSSGTRTWRKRFYFSISQPVLAGSCCVSSTGNVYVTFTNNQNTVDDSIVVLGWDNDGTSLQFQTQIRSGASQAVDIGADSSNNVYVLGRCSEVPYLFKYNSSGTLQWQRQMSYSTSTSPYGLYVDTSGNCYISNANTQQSVLKYNSSGTLQWQRNFRVTSATATYGGKPFVNNSNDLLIACTMNYNGSVGDMGIIKMPSAGTANSGTTFLTMLSGAATDSAGSATSSSISLSFFGNTGSDADSSATDAAGSGVSSISTQSAVTGAAGLVWIKSWSSATGHALYDTARGATFDLASNSDAAQTTQSTGLTSFGGSGFNIGSLAKINTNADTYTSWTFKKAPKFFDIVQYTGNGSNRTINHGLGSVPGMIIVKKTSSIGTWAVYHRSLSNNDYITLNSTNGSATETTYWNSTTPTSSTFSLGTNSEVNQNGETYIAYLFAHDAGGFGLDGSQNVISCGSYTGNASGDGPNVNIGFEPQILLIKCSSQFGQNWLLIDNMRGMPWAPFASSSLYPNTANSEHNGLNYVSLNSNGFQITSSDNIVNANQTYIYMAIRRAPMRTPTVGTTVFSPNLVSNDSATGLIATTNFPVDLFFEVDRTGGGKLIADRMRNAYIVFPYQNNAEVFALSSWWRNNLGLSRTDAYGATNIVFHSFRRAPSFMDIVGYQGNGSTPRAINHGLGVVPQLIFIKNRSDAIDWCIYSEATGNSKELILNSASGAISSGRWGFTSPTLTQFYVSNSSEVNSNGNRYIAYLFASCPNVSKVGSYTGTGSTQAISCGFTGGARYVLIKRTDSTGNWWVWDTARGMVSGTDPRAPYNTTAAETNTNWVYTATGGFQIVTSDATVNANGGSYIYLAIA